MSVAIAPRSETMLDAYRRDGFVIVPGLFSAAMRGAIARDLIDVFAARATMLGVDLPDGVDQGALSALTADLFAKDIPSYIAAAKLTQHLASVHRIGVSAEVMSVLDALNLAAPCVSTRPVIHYMADRLKIPGGYQKTPPHQDWRSVQGSLDGVTIWSPLFDVGLDDYPLEIIPGSHVHGLLDATPDMPNYRIRGELIDETIFRPLTLKAGDAVAFSGFLVHRTGARGGQNVRVSLSFRFNNAAEPRFAERNFPDTYVYRAEPSIVTPDFPTPADLAAVFGGRRT
jgi:phytanoyl-CoA hydroxylase